MVTPYIELPSGERVQARPIHTHAVIALNGCGWLVVSRHSSHDGAEKYALVVEIEHDAQEIEIVRVKRPDLQKV